MRRLAILVLFLGAPLAARGDGVRLRNGKYLSGTVILDQKDTEGFRVRPWDTDGEVYVHWSQVPPGEKNRLLGIAPGSQASGPLLDGIRVLTAGRDVVGLLVREDPAALHVKTRDSRSPVAVPRSSVLAASPLKLTEADVYTPEERLDARAAKAGEKDFEALVEASRFAASQRLHERARDLLEKAARADPARAGEVEGLLAANESLRREERAGALLAEVRSLSQKSEFARALQRARQLLGEFAETAVATGNAGLVETIEKEAREFAANRAQFLSERVPPLWAARRSALLAGCASAASLAMARRKLAGIDAEIVARLAADLKSTPEEILAAWQKREEKPRSAGFGSGSWVVKGGQDGGLDCQTPPVDPNAGGGGVLIPVTDAQGRTIWVHARGTPPKPKTLGRPLQTHEEWWRACGDRRSWVEAEYARTSKDLKLVSQRAKACAACNGAGGLNAVRHGQPVQVICPRCHGVKEDLLVDYW